MTHPTPALVDIEELESLAKAADQGPLDIERRDDDEGTFTYVVYGSDNGDTASCCEIANSNARANSAFIAAANPSTVLALLAELRALRSQANEYGRHPFPTVAASAELEADIVTIDCALDALSALRYERIPTDDAAEVSAHNRAALSRIAAALGLGSGS